MSGPAPTFAMLACIVSGSATAPSPRARAARGDDAGLRRAHGYLQGRIARRAPSQAHAGAGVHIRRDHRPRDARPRSSSRRPVSAVSGSDEQLRAAKRSFERIPSDERFVLARHENPARRRAGLADRHAGAAHRAGKDSMMFIAPADLPLPTEVPRVPARRAHRGAARPISQSARSCSWTAATPLRRHACRRARDGRTC